MLTTVGQVLANDALPPELRDYGRVLDGKTLSALLRQVAEKYPDKYRDVSYRLNRLGAQAAQEQGGHSFGLRHLRKSEAAKKLHEGIKSEVQAILKNRNLTPKQKNERIIVAVGKRSEEQQKQIFEEALANKNPLALQVQTGSRGKPANLSSLLGGDLLYTDHRGNVIPIPVLRSYSQGLSPAEFFAGTYGARKGIIDVKQATADSGYFSKQLVAASHRLLVADRDSGDYDPESPRGLVVETDDPDNEGALLAKDFGDYKRNTPLTPKILADLKNKGFNNILVRSPIIGGSPEGGVYAYDVGVRDGGRLPGRGEFVGIQSAGALGEPLSQGMLCLAAGTLVRMADGDVSPIDSISAGDYVLGADRDGLTFAVKVTAHYDNGVRRCHKYAAADIDIVCTPDHKLLSASKGKSGYLQCAASNCREVLLEDGRILPVSDAGDAGLHATYDIEVDHPDHLFVLANGLIVSNSSKHSGGVAGQEKTTGGFAAINALVQVPKKMPTGAAHSTEDGYVEAIQEAPAGGYYVTVGGKQHYVARGRELKVKKGDPVEAGDVLSDGLPSPAIVTEYKGIGEGRRYFTKVFQAAMKAGGVPAHRRNVELLARGLLNHVQLTEETDSNVPDDIVPYSTLEHTYKPREGHIVSDIKHAAGKYLEKPVLHYTIGTKVRPSVLKQLQEFGVKNVTVHADPPPFQAHMVRGMYQMQHDPDFLTQMYGSGLKKSLLDSVAHGGKSRLDGSSFVPSLATTTDFGFNPDRMVKIPEPRKPLSSELDLPVKSAQDNAADSYSSPNAGAYSGISNPPKPAAPAAPAQPSAPAAPAQPATNPYAPKPAATAAPAQPATNPYARAAHAVGDTYNYLSGQAVTAQIGSGLASPIFNYFGKGPAAANSGIGSFAGKLITPLAAAGSAMNTIGDVSQRGSEPVANEYAADLRKQINDAREGFRDGLPFTYQHGRLQPKDPGIYIQNNIGRTIDGALSTMNMYNPGANVNLIAQGNIQAADAALNTARQMSRGRKLDSQLHAANQAASARAQDASLKEIWARGLTRYNDDIGMRNHIYQPGTKIQDQRRIAEINNFFQDGQFDEAAFDKWVAATQGPTAAGGPGTKWYQNFSNAVRGEQANSSRDLLAEHRARQNASIAATQRANARVPGNLARAPMVAAQAAQSAASAAVPGTVGAVPQVAAAASRTVLPTTNWWRNWLSRSGR